MRTAAAAGVVLLIVAAFSIPAELTAPYDPLEQDVAVRLSPPGKNHLFGTDGFGRDQFSRVLYATRTALIIGTLAVCVAGTAGVLIGSISAYRGGTTDILIQRFVDLFIGIPFLVLCVVFVIAFGPSTVSVALALSVALTPQVIRVVRSSVLAVKAEYYVEAARISGAGETAVITRHVLANALPPIASHLAGVFGTAVIAESTLSFLGLGVPAPYPSLGRMLREGASRFLESAPWLTLFPGALLTIIVIAGALIGDAVGESS